MAIAGVPPVVFVAVGLIDLLYQFWIHTELVGKLGWFDRVFASPSNHRVHHGVNDLYLDKNYGGILIVWDRLFGTYEDEVEPAVYGVRGGLSTFDPISANLSYYATMADLSWRAADWRDKIRVWFAPPGWVPANLRRSGASSAVRPQSDPPLRPARRASRDDPRLCGAPRYDRRDGGVPDGRPEPAPRQRARRLPVARSVVMGDGVAARRAHIHSRDALRLRRFAHVLGLRARLAGRRNRREASGDGAANRFVRDARRDEPTSNGS